MKLYIMASPPPAFFTKIKAIPSPNKKEDNKSIIEALRWLDTIHDFYPVDATGRGENIREILSRQYWPDPVGKFNEKTNNGVSKFMDKFDTDKSVDNKKIASISPSDVEKQTERYYKDHFNIINVGKHTIDAKTIVDKYIADNDITASKILEEVGVPAYTKLAEMQLKLTDRRFFKADKSATNFLANVILTFFLGADINRDVYFLIDAAAGRLDCMFQDIDQVSTLINVLTIGDSAVGNPNEVKKTKQENKQDCGVDDFKNKFKRKVYFAAPNTLPYTEGQKYSITSNEFTKGKITMWYQDADLPFSKQNNASARLYVQYEDKEPWFTEFSFLASGAPNSGASVGTLKKLITALNNESNPDTPENRIKTKTAIKNIYKYETQFNLTPILCGMLDSDMTKDAIISFLYDYKRAGDHEQANSAKYLYKKKGINVILLTGDRLCSLYARLIGQPCIYIHKDEYDMYRNFREVSEDQKKANAISLLKSRKAFILAEIDKIVTVKIGESLVALKMQINGFKELPDKFEDSLYNFILKSLIKKIDRLSDLLTAYEVAKAGMILAVSITIDEAEESTVIETAIKTLNDKYNEFNEKYKEIFNFALYSLDIAEVTAKNKFNSPALDYDNKLVKNILDYFAKFHKKNIVPGASRDKPLAIKKNLINRIGQEDYDILYGDLLEYLKKCNSYKKEVINDETTLLSGMPKVGNDIKNKINEPTIGDHTFEDYKDIFDNIKAFIFGIIQAPEAAVAQAAAQAQAEVAEAQAEEAAPAQAPAAVDISLPEEIPKERIELIKNEEKDKLNLMKISLYEWAKSKEFDKLTEVEVGDVTIGTQINPIEYNKQLTVVEPGQSEMVEDDKKLTFVETEERNDTVTTENENLKDKIAEIDAAVINLADFETILNAKLENEYKIFYSAVEPPVEMEQGGGGMNDDIKVLLDNYYANVIIAHYQELVDAYLYSTEDVDKKIITEKMGQIYNYVFKTNLYPETVYEYLYNGLAAKPAYEKNQQDTIMMDTTPIEGESTEGYIEVKEREEGEEGEEGESSKTPVQVQNRKTITQHGFLTPAYTPGVQKQPEVFERKRSRSRSRSSLSSTSESGLPPTPGSSSNSAQKKRKIELSHSASSRSASSSFELADVPVSRKRHNPSANPTAKRQKIGGKGTRKYKNKRNKKTRNKNKKTKKNKTIKKKRNRKQRNTRRN